jgi:hypothetical protein
LKQHSYLYQLWSNLAVSFNRYVIYVSDLSTYCLFSLFFFLSFGHCIVCPLNYDFWSSFWYIQIFLLLKFTLLTILHVYFYSHLCFTVVFFYLRSNISLLSLDFFTRIFVLEWAAAVRQLQSIVPNNTRYIVGITITHWSILDLFISSQNKLTLSKISQLHHFNRCIHMLVYWSDTLFFILCRNTFYFLYFSVICNESHKDLMDITSVETLYWTKTPRYHTNRDE